MAKGPRITMETLNSEVTGSACILNVKRPGNVTRKILIDYGGYQEDKYRALNDVIEFEPSEIDTVIVTHSHMDHIFKLPLLYKNGYTGNVYCSKITAKSLPIALKNSAEVIEREYQSSKRHKKDIKPIYTKDDTDNVQINLVPVDYNEKIEILPNIFITLLGNGHLYGAASILLEVKFKKLDPINALFTSDYYPTNDLYEVVPFPDYVYNLKNLSVTIESTYGATNQTDIPKNFYDLIIEAIQKKNFIVIPSIAQERLELILLALKNMQDSNLLDIKIPIYVHSNLGLEFHNRVYKNSNCICYMPKNCEFIGYGDYQTVLSDGKQTKILIASSGMLDQGNIVPYLKYVISNPNATIIFTCYQGKGTRGHKIKYSKPNEKISIMGVEYERHCSIKSTGQFSKHIKQDEAIAFLSKFHDLKNIFITHGDEKKKEIFKIALQNAFPDKNIFITNRETGFLISSIHEVSSYKTKLKDVSYYKNYYNLRNAKDIENIHKKRFKKTTKKRHTQKKCSYC